MLTARELASGAYQGAIAQSRRRILGVEEMTVVTDDRLSNLRNAQRLIAAARGTERHFLREPDDARLEQMLHTVERLTETATDDRSRWASR